MVKIDINPTVHPCGEISNSCYISDPLRVEQERLRALLDTLQIAPLSGNAFKAAHEVVVSKLCTIVSHTDWVDKGTKTQFRTIGKQFGKVYSVHGSTVPASKQTMVQAVLNMMSGEEPFDASKAHSLSMMLMRTELDSEDEFRLDYERYREDAYQPNGSPA